MEERRRIERGCWTTIDEGQGVWWDANPTAWRLTPTSANAALIAVGIFPR